MKFEKVKNALEDKTRNSGNFITLSKNVDARHTGKYVTKNVVTNHTSSISYSTLQEVIDEFELEIK